MRSQDPIDLARYNRCRNRLRGLTRRLRREFESRLIADLRVNPKAFWKYTNSRLKVKPWVGDLRNSAGTLVTDDQTKASVLNDFFAGVFTSESSSSIPGFVARCKNSLLSDITISRQAVENKLHTLKPASAPGPDGVHPRILRELSHSLSLPLSLLYCKSIDTGRLPSIWK